MIATATGAALLLAASGSPRGDKEGGTFRVGMPVQIFDSIDPALARFPAPTELFRATCASLLNYPDKPVPAGLRHVPEVAANFPTISRDGKTYTFTILKSFRFSTGAPVTARDFAASINRVLNPALKSPRAGDLLRIVGAQAVLDGKAITASGVIVQGSKLIVRLTRPVPDLPARVSVCVLPANLPFDPEGVRAPVPTAGPYFISEYVPGERVVLKRNRFYSGRRPHHVDRFLVTLDSDPGALLDQVERGELDYAFVPNNVIGARAPELASKYGVNRARFFVKPGQFLRIFVLNTSRPLFRNNVKLRQAVNFAVDRAALLRERGGSLVGTLTDQYLTPTQLGFRDERIYPLREPDLATARALARGRTRSGKAVLYVISSPDSVAQGQIVRATLKRIGLEVEVKPFPGPVLFQKLATAGEPFDIGWIGWGLSGPDPAAFLYFLFGGRTIGQPGFGNWSYLNSPKYNRLLDQASRLAGEERYRAYGELDVQLSRDAAPAIPYAYDNALTLVSTQTGCIVLNPYLDLAAVCLK